MTASQLITSLWWIGKKSNEENILQQEYAGEK